MAKKMGFVEYVEAFPTVVSLPTLAFLALKSAYFDFSLVLTYSTKHDIFHLLGANIT